MVISVELSAQILRLYQAERWRVGTIAAQLHVHRDTVRRVLAQAGLSAPTLPLRPSRVDRYRPFILQTLAKFPTLTAARLFVMVHERGYSGSPEHFRHLIAGMRPRPAAEAFLRLRTLPGEQAQVDWGLCRARHRPHYAECPGMPSSRPRAHSLGCWSRRTSMAARHSPDAYRFFRKVSNASSGLKVDGAEPGGVVLAKTLRFNSRSALR